MTVEEYDNRVQIKSSMQASASAPSPHASRTQTPQILMDSGVLADGVYFDKNFTYIDSLTDKKVRLNRVLTVGVLVCNVWHVTVGV